MQRQARFDSSSVGVVQKKDGQHFWEEGHLSAAAAIPSIEILSKGALGGGSTVPFEPGEGINLKGNIALSDMQCTPAWGGGLGWRGATQGHHTSPW